MINEWIAVLEQRSPAARHFPSPRPNAHAFGAVLEVPRRDQFLPRLLAIAAGRDQLLPLDRLAMRRLDDDLRAARLVVTGADQHALARRVLRAALVAHDFARLPLVGDPDTLTD